MSFRTGLYLGLLATVALGLFLFRLWQPEPQVRKHSAHLLAAAADKNWTKLATFIAEDYHDQWGHDRAAVLERTREIFRSLRGVQVHAVAPNSRIEDRSGYWLARITIDGNQSELMTLLKERVNSLRTPFELEWRRYSAKPWDWKLVSVRNAELLVPADY